MRRHALLLVIAASLLVLGALFVLFRAISEQPPAPAPATAPSGRAQVSPGSPTRPTGIPAITALRPRPSRQSATGDEPAGASSGAPGEATAGGSGADSAPPGTRQNTNNLQLGAPQLREQIAGNSEKIRGCLQAAGGAPTGDAVVTFIVARKAGTFVVEQTDVDRDQTTVQGDPLLECMHQAARSMTFSGLPRDAEAIIVTRAIRLDAGQLADDRFVKFSYLR